jgi:hypothetical protein
MQLLIQEQPKGRWTKWLSELVVWRYFFRLLIGKCLGSNLGFVTVCFDGILRFSSVQPGNFRARILNLATTAFFHILSSSLHVFTSLNIRRHIIWAIDILKELVDIQDFLMGIVLLNNTPASCVSLPTFIYKNMADTRTWEAGATAAPVTLECWT